jgi:hypothetical protein
MAVYLIKAKRGANYTPPQATGTVFSDVSAGAFAAAYIEEQNREQIMTSCGTPPCGAFNPSGSVTRADMAKFLIVAQRGPGFQPPTATGIFTDVHSGDYNADYIEQLFNEGITGGCQSSPLKYCPASPNTRAQMAVFMNKTFKLP